MACTLRIFDHKKIVIVYGGGYLMATGRAFV